MGRGHLVLDIETVPDLDLWQPPEPQPGEPAAFAPHYAQRVVAIGAMLLDDAYGLQRMGIVGDRRPEVEQLRALAGWLERIERERPILVSYNGRGFDLPVIALRCLGHGVPFAFYYSTRDVRYRYSEDGHLDLMDCLTDHGAARPSPSLDALARTIGLPGKLGTSGAQVDEMFRAGRLDEIKTYCLGDVAQTAFLLLRYRLLQGRLLRDGYRARAGALLARLEETPATRDMCARIDRARLLLSEECGEQLGLGS